ncbi:26578_t:CDS:1, partial [Gigaspora margarita]
TPMTKSPEKRTPTDSNDEITPEKENVNSNKNQHKNVNAKEN